VGRRGEESVQRRLVGIREGGMREVSSVSSYRFFFVETRRRDLQTADSFFSSFPSSPIPSLFLLALFTQVLLTGASGYIAVHVTESLFEQGFKVVGTVRSNEKVSSTFQPSHRTCFRLRLPRSRPPS